MKGESKIILVGGLSGYKEKQADISFCLAEKAIGIYRSSYGSMFFVLYKISLCYPLSLYTLFYKIKAVLCERV